MAEQIENSRLEKIEENKSDASEGDLHGEEKEQITLPLRFRSDSDSDADDANDAFKSKASPPLNPLPEQEVTLMTLSDNHNQNKIDIEEKEQLHTFTLIDEREELLRACKETTSCFRVG